MPHETARMAELVEHSVALPADLRALVRVEPHVCRAPSHRLVARQSYLRKPLSPTGDQMKKLKSMTADEILDRAQDLLDNVNVQFDEYGGDADRFTVVSTQVALSLASELMYLSDLKRGLEDDPDVVQVHPVYMPRLYEDPL